MTFRFVDAQNAMYPILLPCRVLEVSRGGYYAWRQRQARPSARHQRNAVLQTVLRKLHADGRCVYGSPRLTKVARAAGIAIGRHATARLMRREGLVGRCGSRRTRSALAPASTPVIPNRLMRSFKQLTPNRVWVTDITYLPTKHGTLYLAVVLDLYSRSVVGHASPITCAPNCRWRRWIWRWGNAGRCPGCSTIPIKVASTPAISIKMS